MEMFWSACWRVGAWLMQAALERLDAKKRQAIVDANGHRALARVTTAWLDGLIKLRDDLIDGGTEQQQYFFYSLGPPHNLTVDAIIVLPPKQLEQYKDLLGLTGVGVHLMAAHAKAWSIFDACAEDPQDVEKQMGRLAVLIARLEVARDGFLELARSDFQRST
ncbi:hypothetical protein ACQQ2N_04680 [Dokdonella sp. MW10]|uniref:hypothetical protein n=1 Tax=Dokdonella sp. MW10 TaxID=2992926 RepID=UPI003F7FA862